MIHFHYEDVDTFFIYLPPCIPPPPHPPTMIALFNGIKKVDLTMRHHSTHSTLNKNLKEQYLEGTLSGQL